MDLSSGIMQPLVPLPENSSPPPTNNASGSNTQPSSLFDLISSSSHESTSPPLFPVRKPAASPAPVRIPLLPATPPTSKSDLPTSPGFGDFVSVPPSLDPLALSSPTAFSNDEPSFGTNFVQDAKARTAEKERKVMEEFRQAESEKDPLGLLSERKVESAPPAIPLELEPEEEIVARPVNMRTSSELKRVESAPSFTPLNDSPETEQPPVPTSSSPTTSPLGLSGRLSLPRSWTSILSSSLPSLPPATTTSSWLHQTPPANPTDLPPHAAPSRESSITHKNPFAHTFVPPSGAPGYTGEHWDKGFIFGEEDKVVSKGPRIKLVGRTEMTTPVLTAETADMLRPSLPALRRLTQKWTLLYSLDQHGISLGTFYSRCEQPVTGGCLVAIRDSEGATFGVWCGDGVRKHEGYTGSGESFLWTQKQDKGPVKVFKWTGKNDYVRLCESDFISFGGGNGKFGLYLDSAFLDGESAPCPTFDNEVLCSNSNGPRSTGTVKFECVGVEAWGIA